MVSLNGLSGGLTAGLPNLILSRRRGEITEIQDEHGNVIAEVSVTEIRHDKVRLSFQAPSSVGIYRREVANAIRAERTQGKGPRVA